MAVKHGENLYNYIFDAAGKPTDYLNYLINDSNIHSLGGFDTVLTDGDSIAVVPSLGAG
jgi:molybdopterin converting factor small subunit